MLGEALMGWWLSRGGGLIVAEGPGSCTVEMGSLSANILSTVGVRCGHN